MGIFSGTSSDRFKTINTGGGIYIYIDIQTGVNYVSIYSNSTQSSLTPLYNANGTLIITK